MIDSTLNYPTSTEIEFHVGCHGTPPSKAYEGDVGFDLYAAEDVFIPLGETKIIMTDVSVSLPTGSFGMIKDRSSMAVAGLSVGGGIIDEQYTGEIKVILHNLTGKTYLDPVLLTRGYKVVKGNKIAQMLVLPNWQFETKPNNQRGDGGLGSSGK